MNTAERNLRIHLAAVVALIVCTAASAALADTGETAFLRTEMEVLGAEVSTLASARAAQQDDQKRDDRRSEFDWGVQEEDEDSAKGPSNLGRKVKATLLSAVLPGAGQWYNGDRRKAYYMGAAEVGIWGAFFVFDHMGDSSKDSATDYANIYAGTSGEHNDSYWINVGSHMDSDSYYDAVDREARALGEDYPVPRTGDPWQWVNDDRRQDFWRQWGDAHDAYDMRDYMYIFALVNRVVSMVDAALGVDDTPDGVIETGLLGVDVHLAVSPAADPATRRPGARLAFARSF